jgi:acyl-CoA dehydrogenase
MTAERPESGFGLNPQDALNDLRMSEKSLPLFNKVRAFIVDVVNPMSEEFHRLGEGRPDPWQYAPGQLEALDAAKEKAKKAGLWNFFLPNAETGEGLSNLDYAYIAVELGKNRMASETMNCAAPDTGNMEVLERVGTAEQKKQWLEPLLAGKIRSAYCMTELNTASSDAKNIDTRAVRVGDEYIISGEKHYISGAGDPRCKVMICMVRTGGEHDSPHLQQSQILVPLPTEGVEIVQGQQVFGDPDAPHGHMHIRFHNARVPASNMLLGEGRGFEIAQGRLGPGRIHHCMRLIGQAERALEKMCKRATERVAFGRPVSDQGVTRERIAEARIMIDSARFMVLNAAWKMDTVGNKIAKKEIAMIKVLAPTMACQVIDWAMQVHGGGGVSEDFGLAHAYAHARTLRFADGPDEVHRNAIAKLEIGEQTTVTEALAKRSHR